MNNMSYICEFCGLRPECCACSVDLTEPRLVPELAVADNIMAVENPRPYGLLNAPSASAFFSLLVELEEDYKDKDEDFELGPPPKWMRQTNNQLLVEEERPLIYDEPMLTNSTTPTTPIKADQSVPPIPKLERQTNMPEEIQIENDDLLDLAIELFPEDQYVIEYCENCCDFSCECDKMFPCDCGKLYHIDEPYGMCFDCEMAQRRQESIDQELYPDDIRERF